MTQQSDTPDKTGYNLAVGRAFAITTLTLVLLAMSGMTSLAVTGHIEIALASAALMIALVMLFFPRYCFWLFLVSLVGGFSMQTSAIAIHPYDLAMALLTGSLVLDYFLRGHYRAYISRFDLPFIFLVGATLLSGLFAFDRSESIVPIIRIFLVYIAFRIVFKLGRELSAHLLIKRILHGVALLSLVNCLQYVWTGGEERIFGIAANGFRTFSMTALPMAFAYLLWSDNRRDRWKFAGISFLIGLALIATQSRAPLIAVFGSFVWITFTVVRMRRREETRKVMKWLKLSIAPIIVLLFLVLIFSHTLFSVTLDRYYRLIESVNNPESSIAMRYVLWAAALKAFVAHPLTGIGIGNFAVIEQIFPDVTLAALWLNVSHMSAHNVVLHYMAETGIVGALAIIFLAFRGVKVTRKMTRLAVPGKEGQASFAIFGAIVIFALTIFFMEGWMWGQDGYVLAIVFGLAAARWWELDKRRQSNEIEASSANG